MLKIRHIHARGTGSIGMAPRIMDPFSTNEGSNFGRVSTWNMETNDEYADNLQIGLCALQQITAIWKPET